MAYDLSTQEGRDEARRAAGGEVSGGYFLNGDYVRPTGGGGAMTAQTAAGGGGGSGYSQEEQDLINAYKDASGFKIRDLEERSRQFNENLKFERDRMERIGVPELQIKQQLARLQETQVKAEMGLAYLNTAASFAASDPFQLVNFIRGAQQQGAVPMFLSNLRDLVVPQTQGAPVAGQAPAAITAGNLEQALGGGTVQGGANVGPDQAAAQPSAMPGGLGVQAVYGGTDINQTLDTASQVFQRGADALPVGALEATSDTELNLLGAAVRQKHGDQAFPAFLQNYAKNPVRQQRAATASMRG